MMLEPCSIENADFGTISSHWDEPEQKPRIRDLFQADGVKRRPSLQEGVNRPFA
jgi:hypothetical protein